MPGRLRRLSGRELCAVLGRFGFEVVAVRGSHAKLRREAGGPRQSLTIPLHKELASSLTPPGGIFYNLRLRLER